MFTKGDLWKPVKPCIKIEEKKIEILQSIQTKIMQPFSGNLALEGNYFVQFCRKTYNLEGIFCLFHTKMSKNLL